MLAWELQQLCQPLAAVDRPIPEPQANQVVLRVLACGICRTDLHVIDGEVPHAKPHVVPGHEVVGQVVAVGPGMCRFAIGQRVGIPWLGWTCRQCRYCATGRENLCDHARFTGYTLDGGYAEFVLADQDYCLALPPHLDDAHLAPLLCAGLIGYRCLKMAGDATRLGLFGFGAAAHIVAQVARWQGREVLAFTRPGDVVAQQFARNLGAVWAGDSNQPPPVELDAAIIFAPIGALVPAALASVVKGGTVVCGGIHMTSIPEFEYRLLWGERIVRSVANLTRQDGEEFLQLAVQVPIGTQVTPYPLRAANRALLDVRHGKIQGAAVLLPG